jgi:hypothetical protein
MCGRSYTVKICARGHGNPRGTQFCSTCGSGEFSTPAPPERLSGRVARAILQLTIGAGLVAVLASSVVAIASQLDWSAITQSLMSVLVLLCLSYWLTTLLPSPVKKMGKGLWRAAAKRRSGRSNRH